MPLIPDSIQSIGVFHVDDPFNPMPDPGDADPETVAFAFFIGIAVVFSLLLITLVCTAAYLVCTSSYEGEYDEELANNGDGSRRGILNFRPLFGKKNSNGLLLDSNFTNPGEFDDNEEFIEREREALIKMSPFEVDSYMRAKEFQIVSPPAVQEFGTYLDSKDLQMIKDRGIQSYYFIPSINDNVDKSGHFLPSFLVQDKLEVEFTRWNKSSSAVLNYPLPYNKKDAVYFEVKVYNHKPNSNSIFSIGLVTVPYPYFRIPGMCKFSIAYESTGKLRINDPFFPSTLLPKLVEGDVVGFGYRFKTGTIFITHNGKKLMDVTQNVGVELFIALGAMNASYTRTYTKDGLLEDPDNIELRNALAEGRELKLSKDIQNPHNPMDETKWDIIDSDEIELHVNLGQTGFVFIEANVKKYGFGSVFGEIGIPPAYNPNDIQKDKLIQKGEELPPQYPEDTENFGLFGNLKIKSHIKNPLKEVSSNPSAPELIQKKLKTPIVKTPKVGIYEFTTPIDRKRETNMQPSINPPVYEINDTRQSSPEIRNETISNEETVSSSSKAEPALQHGQSNKTPNKRQNKKTKQRKNKKKGKKNK
ncbi:Protein SSH4 [Nakaseomyces glabratus]|uniref:Protein SSH4 n=1 Tax=Candida glabrata TaxID=5478 RepID=A0A0W0D3L9_CANGB|nr:SPRY domain [Nakaseomyces glabratus]KAH7592746.1 SPRY domain [Nakaseomyces glabratus]KAH7610591.1 SPRY domain [Nakaseomyces glabratus]KTB04167.1 Protein SSH4 [Nakaseomyces glabratus]KTB04359.1 Protein SSH4 [Nakaseomyces glabratus]